MPLKYAGLPPGDRASGDIGILFPIIPCKKNKHGKLLSDIHMFIIL
jgi:hypothetical protein